jgi:hypothetical protein
MWFGDKAISKEELAEIEAMQANLMNNFDKK